jgi:uncharacterized repeat protein (TIGR01451 family)
MSRYVKWSRIQAQAAVCALWIAPLACAQGSYDVLANKTITVRTVAEVETRVSQNGHEAIKLGPADRVVPGDQVIYTLEIRNTAAAEVPAPSVSYRIPDHMRYVGDSAAGPGAEVSYSIDGGRTFDRPENLKVAGPSGEQLAATAADYTHIRWQLKHSLKGNSVAFARFRAVVK